MMPGVDPDWWKRCVIYQVYPRSFQDSNGDGIGDLQGIATRLDYLADLGIDLIWLGPICESPNADMGYDVSDYTSIMREFGTMADFDTLLAEARKRDIGLMIDLVVNHSSDQHRWFQDAVRSGDSQYRDYYIWRQSAGGGAPNNWQSLFGGPAWTCSESTGDYYLHQFSSQQPDLNWKNSELRSAIHDIMRFWLDKGVAGFRLDVISFISKPDQLRDADSEEAGDLPRFYASGPRVHQYLREMRREVLSHYDVVTVGEAPGVTAGEAIDYIAPDRQELDMVFLFDLMQIDRDPLDFHRRKDWSVDRFRQILRNWDECLAERGWNSAFLGNHDFPRIVSRFGNDDAYRKESAKMLATLVFTMKGTPFIYNGDEIGMTDVRYESIADYRDISTLNAYKSAVAGGMTEDAALEYAMVCSRDNSRTPMQWDASPNAGFTSGESAWLGVNPNFAEINVAAATSDPGSILHYYRQLIRLRKQREVLATGTFELLPDVGDEVIAFLRCDRSSSILVILNFGARECHANLPPTFQAASTTLVIGNYGEPHRTLATRRLLPYQALVFELDR